MKIKNLILSLFLTTPTYAATSGSLLLKSIVPKVFSVVVNPTTLASTLPLETTQANSTVAGVALKANTQNGYKVTITSANTGKLVHQTNAASTMPYTMKFDGQSVNLSTGTTLVFNTSGPTNKNAPVQISYTGVPYSSLQQGDYTDTVTFTVSSL